MNEDEKNEFVDEKIREFIVSLNIDMGNWLQSPTDIEDEIHNKISIIIEDYKKYI